MPEYRKKPEYGIDAPYAVISALAGGLVGVSLGVTLRVTDPASPYWSIPFTWGIVGLGYASIFVLSSKFGKLSVRDRILERVDWKGDERVLDVGCGRGLLLIGAAKRLETGKAIGIDIWRKMDQTGHDPILTLENARRERVEARVEVRDGDARNIPFGDSSFDVVLSSLVIHNIPSRERAKVLQEMVRVLKPGGRLVVSDIWSTRAYAKALRNFGMQEVKLSWTIPIFLSPNRIVTATKP